MGVERFNGFAIVVGVGTADVAVTADDAKAVTRVLSNASQGGYEKVVTLTRQHATLPKVSKALVEAEQWAAVNPNGTVVFYFSGHGRAFPKDGRLHDHYLELWSPREKAPARLRANVLDLRLRKMNCRNTLVILDCCFAGAARVGRRRSKSTSAGQFAQQLGGHLLLASSLAHQRSWTHKDRGSIFTECLLEALQGRCSPGGDHARVFDLLSYVFREVPQRAARHDVEQAPFVSSRIDFEENFPVCRVSRVGGATATVVEVPPARLPKRHRAVPEHSVRWLMLLSRELKATELEGLEKRLRDLLEDSTLQLIRGRDAEPVLECTASFTSFLKCRERLRRGELADQVDAPVIYLVGTPPPRGEPNDVQWGKFDLMPHRSGRRLWATVRKHFEWPGYFDITLEVTALKGHPPLRGKVTFFLHDSYSRSKQEVRVRNGRASWKVEGWGSYTVGAEVQERRGPPLRLELDLGNIPKVPRGFIDDA